MIIVGHNVVRKTPVDGEATVIGVPEPFETVFTESVEAKAFHKSFVVVKEKCESTRTTNHM